VPYSPPLTSPTAYGSVLDGSHHPDRANTTSFSRKPIFPDCGGLSRIRIEGERSLDGSHHPDRANTTSFSRKPIFPDCGGLSEEEKNKVVKVKVS